MSGRGFFSNRNLSLAAVCIQSTVLAVVLHVSQARLRPGQAQYKPSSAVLITEVGKLVISLFLALRDVYNERHRVRALQVHPLPSPDLYAKGEEVHAKGLYADDPYDLPPPAYGTPDMSGPPMLSMGAAVGGATRPPMVRRGSSTMSFHKRPGSISMSQSGSGGSIRARKNSLALASTAAPLNLDVAYEGGADQSLLTPPSTAGSFKAYSWPRSPVLREAFAQIGVAPPSSSYNADLLRPISLLSAVWRDVAAPGWLAMAIPALLFAVQNNLIYVAARNLPVPVYQVTFQIKTLITALAAVVMLGRKLHPHQWCSLLLLGAGVATMQLGAAAAKPGASGAGAAAAAKKEGMNYLAGIGAVLTSSLFAAVAATYFELVIKRRPAAPSSVSPRGLSIPTTAARSRSISPSGTGAKGPSLWIRNIQLSAFSTLIGIVVVLAQAGPGTWASGFSSSSDTVAASGWWTAAQGAAGKFFEGFQALTWVVIFLQTAGGLFIALAIKHADNVAKGFALSISIVFNFLLSVLIFDFRLSSTALLGGIAVVTSTLLFEADPKRLALFLEDLRGGRRVGRPLLRRWQQVLLVILSVTFLASVLPSAGVKRYSVSTAAWDLVASQFSLDWEPPTVAIANMDHVNEPMARVSGSGPGTCNWGKGPKRWSTTAAYGGKSGIQATEPADFPFHVYETDQYALDDILSTRFSAYARLAPILGTPSPDFIYLPVLSQQWSNPWDCQHPELLRSIEGTTRFIRELVKSVGKTSYPKIVLPVTGIRSNLEKEFFTPEIMEEIKDSVIVLGIEGATKTYKEGMKYVFDVPYPTFFHLGEKWDQTAEQKVDRTEVGDFFLKKERPYLLAYAAATAHPWNPDANPFNGFALRSALKAHLDEFLARPAGDVKILFQDIKDSADGHQPLGLFYDNMQDATFCLQPAGDSPTRRGFYDSLLMGCIPVIFRERSYGRLLPSSPELDTSNYAIYLDENDFLRGSSATLENIVDRLAAIPAAEVARMQRHIAKVASKLQWSIPAEEVFPSFAAAVDPAHTVPVFNVTADAQRKAATLGVGNDAFAMVLKELATIKSGTWRAGISKDTRRGTSMVYVGSRTSR